MIICGVQGLKQPDGSYFWPWISCWGIYNSRYTLLKYRLTLPSKEGGA